ncbi:MAG: high frequency lysogenization protein HflD [Gammaproteobacteria bacterium]
MAKQKQVNLKYVSIALGLASIFQIAYLVDELALTGTCDEQTFSNSIKVIHEIDAENFSNLYDNLEKIKIGLQTLLYVFGGVSQKSAHMNISRYSLSLILLQHKLSHHPSMLKEMKKRLTHVYKQMVFFSETHDAVMANLADIYLNTANTFHYRIHIIGKQSYLRNERILNKIRALFLAGICAGTIWHRVGGRRWHLFFSRKSILNAAKLLLKDTSHAHI